MVTQKNPWGNVSKVFFNSLFIYNNITVSLLAVVIVAIATSANHDQPAHYDLHCSLLSQYFSSTTSYKWYRPTWSKFCRLFKRSCFVIIEFICVRKVHDQFSKKRHDLKDHPGGWRRIYTGFFVSMYWNC